MRQEFRRVNDLPRTAGNLRSDYQCKSPLKMDREMMLRDLREKMLSYWGQKGQSFPNFGEIPAQAQVELMSWNYGLRLRGAPNMCDAVRAGIMLKPLINAGYPAGIPKKTKLTKSC